MHFHSPYSKTGSYWRRENLSDIANLLVSRDGSEHTDSLKTYDTLSRGYVQKWFLYDFLMKCRIYSQIRVTKTGLQVLYDMYGYRPAALPPTCQYEKNKTNPRTSRRIQNLRSPSSARGWHSREGAFSIHTCIRALKSPLYMNRRSVIGR